MNNFDYTECTGMTQRRRWRGYWMQKFNYDSLLAGTRKNIGTELTTSMRQQIIGESYGEILNSVIFQSEGHVPKEQIVFQHNGQRTYQRSTEIPKILRTHRSSNSSIKLE
jgi:hypothetical protein